MKLKIQFDEETRFDVPLPQTIRTPKATCSGRTHMPWSHTTSFGSRLRPIIAQHNKAVQIPVGFQVETGFHLGVESDG